MYSGIRTENIHITVNIYLCIYTYVFHSRKVYAQETVLYCMYINIVQAEIVSCVVGK